MLLARRLDIAISISIAVAVLVSAILLAPARASELKRDQYLLALTEHLKEKNYDAALPVVEKLRALDTDIPDGAYYFFAEVFFFTCSSDEAQANLNEYYVRTGKDGRYYREMLDLFNRIETDDVTDHCRTVLRRQKEEDDAKNLAARCGPPPVFRSQPNTSHKYAITVHTRAQLAEDLDDEIPRYCEVRESYDISFDSTSDPNAGERACVQEMRLALQRGEFWFQKRQQTIDYLRCVENPGVSLAEIQASRKQKQAEVEANSFSIVIRSACKHPIEVAVIWFDAYSRKWSNARLLPQLAEIRPGSSWTVSDRDGKKARAGKPNYALYYRFARGKRIYEVTKGSQYTIKDIGRRHFTELVADPDADAVDTTTIRCG